MQLYYASASPYVRTVRVALAELGMAQAVELIDTKVTPAESNRDYAAVNPLRLIPALALSNGTVLSDSTTILLYLDEASGHKLLPAVHGRWTTLTRYSIAKGLLDQLVGLRYETAIRPEDKRWPRWVDDRWEKSEAALTSLATSVEPPKSTLDLAQIALGCGLGYLDFRFADHDWRAAHPVLASWYEAVAARPSFTTTEPA